MNPNYGPLPPDWLLSQFEVNRSVRRFRRRAILIENSTRWELAACTVESFLPGQEMPKPTHSHQYKTALLFEDVLTGDECLTFIEQVRGGEVRFGQVIVQRSVTVQWCTEQVSPGNEYMRRSGRVVKLQFSQQGIGGWDNVLLARQEPYYPDADTAAQAWLPLRVFHGNRDGRVGSIIFMMPEERAYVSTAAFSDAQTLNIEVAGSEAYKLFLCIKGAYWEGREMHQIDTPIANLRTVVFLPASADRIEYYLIDSEGTIYDFHREDRFSRLAGTGDVLGALKPNLADQVREALHNGEGLNVEYKPLVPPDYDIGSVSKNTKLREILRTVVAFSNTSGGHIYLGIEDDGTVSGADQYLRTWAKADIDDAVAKRYCGALLSRLKDSVDGEISLRLAHTRFDSALVVILEVTKAQAIPVTIRNEQCLYVRRGASNIKLPPDQWKNYLIS
ncbi:MAG: hypothetical protein JWR07_3714 [Nevskia sp.]|nr:hypothetical protein [Nevskia sp.]